MGQPVAVPSENNKAAFCCDIVMDRVTGDGDQWSKLWDQALACKRIQGASQQPTCIFNEIDTPSKFFKCSVNQAVNVEEEGRSDLVIAKQMVAAAKEKMPLP